MRIQTKAKCLECGRVFDLLDEDDAQEWHYGHDCEDPDTFTADYDDEAISYGEPDSDLF